MGCPPLVRAWNSHELKFNYGLDRTVIPSGDGSEVKKRAIVLLCMTRRAVTKDHHEREQIVKRKNKTKQKTKKLSSPRETTHKKQTQSRESYFGFNPRAVVQSS